MSAVFVFGKHLHSAGVSLNSRLIFMELYRDMLSHTYYSLGLLKSSVSNDYRLYVHHIKI